MTALTVSHTLKDKVVLDAIKAANILDRELKKYIGGGMAVHSYIPKKIHRLTTDLDITTNKPMGFSEFKMVVEPVKGYLESLGYNVNVSKSRQTYDLELSDGSNTLQIQVSRKSQANYQNNKKMLEREIENAQERTVDDVVFRALKPEDIILRKAVRIVAFEDRYDVSPIPKGEGLDNQFEYVTQLKEKASRSFDQFAPEEVAHLRLQCDLFDIMALLKHQDFDRDYFKDGAQGYRLFNHSAQRVGKILGAIDERLVD